MKKSLVLGAFFYCLTMLFVQAQHSDSWVINNLNYYKISVGSNGIQRITRTQLQAIGFPVDQNFVQVQLWHRGNQVPIRNFNNDSTITNFIEFLGQKNDGWQDADFFKLSNNKPTHPYYSLYSDTSAYFLTYNTGSSNNKRFNKAIVPALSMVAPFQTFFQDTVAQYFTNDYNTRKSGAADPKPSWGMLGQGWVGGANDRLNKQFKIDHYYNSGIAPKLFYKIVPRAPYKVIDYEDAQFFTHTVNIEIKNTSDNITDTKNGISFTGYNITEGTKDLAPTFISDSGSKNIIVNVTDTRNSSLCYLKVAYSRSFVYSSVGKDQIYSLDQNQSTNNIRILGLDTFNVEVLDVTDLKNPFSLNSQKIGNQLFTTISANTKSIMVRVLNNTYNPKIKSAITFNKLSNADFKANYYILTSKQFINSATQFANYRSSPEGGGHDVKLITMEDLYNQYSYGEQNPIAMRNFCKVALDGTTSKTRYLFLIGRGLRYGAFNNWNKNGGNDWRPQRSQPLIEDLVPAFGDPPSDVVITQGMVQDTFLMPKIATSRFPANTDDEVLGYLEKVIIHEKNIYDPNDPLWRKRMLFLSGGANSDQIRSLKSYVTDASLIMQDKSIGAQTKLLSKDVASNTQKFNIEDEVNAGTSMIYSIGHTSPDVLDVDYGFVTGTQYLYNNKDRFPLVYINGCVSGASFYPEKSIMDDWVTARGRGAIAGLGHTDIGEASTLARYGQSFLSMMNGTHYGKSLSEIQKDLNKNYQSVFQNAIQFATAQTQQLVLLGDPAIVVFGAKLPDYQINDSKLSLMSYNNKPITAVSDSFAIKFEVINTGKYTSDSLSAWVVRTLGDGTQVTYKQVFYAPVGNSVTYYFKIKSKDVTTFGNNTFRLCLNFNNLVQESNLGNNCGTLQYFIPISSVNCLFPEEYSIVSDQNVNFTAQSTNLLTSNTDYYIEIDTSYLFKSINKQSFIVNSASLIKFTKNIFQSIPVKDSTVFFWRLRYANLAPGIDTIWGTSSFTYQLGTNGGWSQGNYGQMLNNTFQRLTPNSTTRNIELKRLVAKFEAQIVGKDSTSSACGNSRAKLDNVILYKPGNCAFFGRDCNALICFVIKREDLNPKILEYKSGELLRNSTDCHAADYPLKMSGMAAVGNQNYLNDFINNSVREGDFFIITSSGNVNFEAWNTSSALLSTLQNLGATKITTVKNGWPYALIVRKGYGLVDEFTALSNTGTPPTSQILNISSDLIIPTLDGNMISTLIGPSQDWGDLYKKIQFVQPNISENWNLKVIGSNLQNTNQVVIDLAKPANGLSIKTLVDANLYPYIQLQATLKDSLDAVPPQISLWQLTYQSVPEGSLVFDKPLIDTTTYRLKTLQEGEKIKLKFAFKNIGTRPFANPLKVYAIINNFNGAGSKQDTITLRALKPDSLDVFEVNFDTKGLVGKNSISINVNPKIQVEKYYYNNTFTTVIFEVLKDNRNPLLDVTFDGNRIANGEIVSPNPIISIKIKDDNKFIKKQDTVGVNLYIKYPNSLQFERINLQNNPKIILHPQSITNKDYRLEFLPSNLPNGRYSLRVEGADGSGNRSGVEPYVIDWEVINESSITNFVPYPNPFTHSTRFVFTITGSQVPDKIKVQILTISGKIVREIFMEELGPIRIGNNISSFAWDGTDQFGDRLANGVYLYKVTAQINNQNIQHRSSASDRGFTQQFGKIYIIR